MGEIHFENAGTKLFAVERGDGPPLVLLHGGLAMHESIWLWATPLASRFRVVTPDLRASGRSVHPGPLSWDLLADDVAALLRHLDVPRAIVGGISFGSAVAVRFALRHPDLTAGVVLLHPAYGGAELGLLPAQRAAMHAMDSLGRRAPAEGIAVLLPLFDTLPEPMRERARRIVQSYDPASVAATTAFMASETQPFERGQELATIGGPALLIPGIDPEHPMAVAEIYRRHLPSCAVRETADFVGAIAGWIALDEPR